MTITANARIAGVMGWPIGHSLSPRLHGYWLDHHGIDGAYVPMAVAPESAREAIRALPLLGFRGCNVTVPLKELALEAVDEATTAARRIGAVNTIVVEAEGRLRGDNTDAFGFLANIQAVRPDWRAEGGRHVVLGAGGAARAVVVALLDQGADTVRLANRTRARAETLARDVDGPVEVVAWDDRHAALEGVATLVNTTTLGMVGMEALDLDLAALPGDAVVNDIVYTPLRTDLLTRAAARGNPTVDGLGMLLHQARPGFECWFGVRPEVTPAMRAFVLESLSADG